MHACFGQTEYYVTQFMTASNSGITLLFHKYSTRLKAT